MHGDNADGVIGSFDDDRLEAASFSNQRCHATKDFVFVALQGKIVHLFLRDDRELGQVDGIRTFSQNFALRTTLTI